MILHIAERGGFLQHPPRQRSTEMKTGKLQIAINALGNILYNAAIRKSGVKGLLSVCGVLSIPGTGA
jgi:hypothetical protein